MKTIEERAREYASDELNPNYAIPAYIASKQQKAYIAGATEQKAIDIEKSKTAFDNACGWLSTYSWYSEVVNEFIKNIEE